MNKYILGVDLGQAHDYTALCVLEPKGVATGRQVPDVLRRIEAGVFGGVVSDATRPEVVTPTPPGTLSGYRPAPPTRPKSHGSKRYTTG